MATAKSYEKVQYDLRPAKQAERRMLIDALQLLNDAGFRIRDYQYTGMGSIHFVDFILLHKYLGISRFLSVEIEEQITKRIEFNKPFRMIETRIGPIGAEIPTLSRDLSHILWLDYDGVISEYMLQDIVLATSVLRNQSLVLVTVDLEPPGGRGPKEWRMHFLREASEYLDEPNIAADFARTKLPDICTTIIDRALSRGLQGRTNVEFIPLFNFRYADGHHMLTMGGMIGDESDKRAIQASRLAQTDYFRSSFDAKPCHISVPRLTRRERMYLDRFMPCDDGWLPEDFELSPGDVRAYRDVYRFLPAYAELLL